ncbi:TPA: hypothetical protein HA295_06180 [Candidatus Woesearchaeota archaeon]|nr:hypothetical protein [Candidatus Woesearchaeota archaeon]
MSIDVHVVGDGVIIGDKAEQLRAKTAALREMGFSTPPRAVFPYEFFLPLLRRIGIHEPRSYQEGLEERIQSAHFSGDELRQISHDVLEFAYDPEQSIALSRLLGESHPEPMMVRSSAFGDAMGNGVYRSHISFNRLNVLVGDMLKVLSSHFSEQGFVFRQKTNAKEGIGVIVEPFLFQELCNGASDIYGGKYFFGPIISGHGYTSTRGGEGYVCVVPGFGAGVNPSLVEILTETMLTPFKGRFSKYIDGKLQDAGHHASHPEAVFSGVHNERLWGSYMLPMTVLMFDKGWNEIYKKEGKGNETVWTLLDAESYGETIPPLSKENLHPLSWWDMTGRKLVYNRKTQVQLDQLNLTTLFKGMKGMEQAFGPQYFEFAVTYGREPRFWITQIADAVMSKEATIPSVPAFFSANTVINSGSGNLDCLVYLTSLADAEKIKELASELGNVGVVYDVSLRMEHKTEQGLESAITSLPNMGLALETWSTYEPPNYKYGHFGVHMRHLGAFFGILDRTDHNHAMWKDFQQGLTEKNGLRMYKGPFKVYANEGNAFEKGSGKMVVQKVA